ncbi:hypothetical protein H8N00_05370 [Streptomyces sp. AC563]|nr:hypothetical protein [Streptomyces buecherae]
MVAALNTLDSLFCYLRRIAPAFRTAHGPTPHDRGATSGWARVVALVAAVHGSGEDLQLSDEHAGRGRAHEPQQSDGRGDGEQRAPHALPAESQEEQTWPVPL